MGLFSRPTDGALLMRLARLETKVDAILAHLGVEVAVEASADDFDDIRALIASGDTIAAIKAYRARTGVGLADAKHAIDSGL